MATSARVAVAANKFAPGIDGSGREVELAYEVLDLADALTRAYRTDAHMVTYVVPGATRQARINKSGLAAAPVMPVVEVFFCDVDNDGHVDWTPESMARAVAQEAELAVLQTAGVYFTAHGRRIVQPIAEPIPVDRVERHLQRWLLQLETAGLAVDWQCKDWTRHFRLPHVRRKREEFRSPRIALDRMRAIRLEPLPEPAAEPDNDNGRPVGEPGVVCAAPAVDWTSELPALWIPKVTRIGQAVRAVAGPWHPLFLALAGALLARGVPLGHVPALCGAVSVATGADSKTADRVRGAKATVRAKLAGRKTTGFTSLAREWPAVADAVDEALARGAHARARAQASAAAPCLPLRQESVAALERALLDAPPGVTLLAAECGLGKTQAAIRAAIEREKRGDKTVISVDKNELALQITADLRRAGASVRRLFGPLSVRRDDGTPECRYHEAALPLVAGGQPVRLVFCERADGQKCEHFAECRARDAADGPEDARILVGPHALLGTLAAAAGAHGLVVMDEPPALLETTAMSLEGLRSAMGSLACFAPRYAAAMTPVVHALHDWMADFSGRAPDDALPFAAAVERAAEFVRDGDLERARRATGAPLTGDVAADLLACVRGAIASGRRTFAPPIQAAQLFACRRAPGFGRRLGEASGILHAIHPAATTDQAVTVRVEGTGRSRRLLLSSAREDLREVLRRDGPTVLMDANVDLHAPVVAGVLGREAPLHRFAASDGAPIARTMLRSGSSTRKRWMAEGKLVLSASVLSAVDATVRWAQEDPAARVLGIITFRALRMALAVARDRDRPDGPAEAAWRMQHGDEPSVDELRAKLGPILIRWPGEILLGHYGAVRGLDSMKDVDCLATIGDPWPRLGEVQHECTFFALPVPWRERVEAMCRAELEQAHGRLRAVHRARPGRALHIGGVLPGGSGWSSGGVEFRRLAGGRPPNESGMTRQELRLIIERLGGVRFAALAASCSPGSIRAYLNGERLVPEGTAEVLRERAAMVA